MPRNASSPNVEVASLKRPSSLMNNFSEPQSRARRRSGSPSTSISEKTALDTKPISANNPLLFSSSENWPLSFTNRREEAGAGYLAGKTRPPTNKSRSPSLSISASARGPVLLITPGIASDTRGTRGLSQASRCRPGISLIPAKFIDFQYINAYFYYRMKSYQPEPGEGNGKSETPKKRDSPAPSAEEKTPEAAETRAHPGCSG